MKKNIIDKVKTFEDACQILGINPNNYKLIVDKNMGLDNLELVTNAFLKLAIITRCLNEGWKPNWDDDKETKYYPWFYMDNIRSFGLHVVSCHSSNSGVSGWLCFKNEDLCKYATKQFKDIYEAYMLNSK